MERVVIKNQFNISYYKLGKFKRTDLYLDAPFRLIPQHLTDSTQSVAITINNIKNDVIKIAYGPDKDQKHLYVRWDIPFTVNENEFILVPHGRISGNDGDYLTVWNPVGVTAGELLSKTSVFTMDKKTTIIQLSALVENPRRGEDILNAISQEFIQSNKEDQILLFQNTLRFIDDRLDVVSKELNGVEGNLENFQGNNEIVNVYDQTVQSLNNSNGVSKDLTDNNVQQGVVEMIRTYFNNPDNDGKLVPSSLGVNDATLISLITHYNELQLKKERETPLLGSNSIVLKDINNQINGVKGSILENLQNISKNLKLQESSLQQKNQQYNQFLSALPHKERMMQDIKRKQGITEGLYLYLLQKREQTAISVNASNVSNYRQIDTATAFGPVEPNTPIILSYSALLGILLPLGFIRLRSLLNDKVIERNDITGKVHLPVLGELAHIPRGKTRGIAVLGRDIIGEQFRIIRTNLSIFLQKPKDKQVFLVTSTSVDEGKSLISLNLAAVLAIPGKKVALLEFDLRSPGIIRNIPTDNQKGLTNYLTGSTDDLSEIRYVMPDIPSMHVYLSGPLPDNPADILLNETVSNLFQTLKEQYDYIVIDSAPTALVSDAFILGEYSDGVIYTIRLRHTLKKQLDFINDIAKAKKLSPIGIVINDVKTGGKHGYGYGYGKENAYTSYYTNKKHKFLSKKPKIVSPAD
jgi:capsular exopolysaccharide synthesis family protein